MLKNPAGAAAGAAQPHGERHNLQNCAASGRAPKAQLSKAKTEAQGSLSHNTTHLSEDCTQAPNGQSWRPKQQQLLLALATNLPPRLNIHPQSGFPLVTVQC
jgi:hypothetical protein